MTEYNVAYKSLGTRGKEDTTNIAERGLIVIRDKNNLNKIKKAQTILGILDKKGIYFFKPEIVKKRKAAEELKKGDISDTIISLDENLEPLSIIPKEFLPIYTPFFGKNFINKSSLAEHLLNNKIGFNKLYSNWMKSKQLVD